MNDYVSCNGNVNNCVSLCSKSSTIPEPKIFCDPVHGHIALHPVCTTIVDTPQFQRLRRIKQTGFLDLVFPGATHNRFGHSLGVCYLAGKLLKEIRYRQPELNVTDVDILCVEIAGLCHDLGHGPFSHTWEQFMRESNFHKGMKDKWKHESVSVNILEYLIKENDLAPELANYGIGPHQIKIIKQMIMRDPSVKEENAFLYQIVNNEESGLDVDKWDYFLRDCFYLGLPCSFEYQRFIQFSKVLVVDGKKQICFRDKMLESVYNMFRTRSNLHRLAYHHRVLKIIDKMFCDALLLSDGKAIGPSGETLDFSGWSMSAAYGKGEELRDALEKFCMLNDNLVFNCLRYSTKPGLEKATQILTAIEKRSCKSSGFYHHVAMKILPSKSNWDEFMVLESLSKLLKYANGEVMRELNLSPSEYENEDLIPLGIEDLDVTIFSIHWGKGERNPVEFVHFYSKNCPLTVKSLEHEESSVILPKSFEEIQLRVLCRRSDWFAIQAANICFDKFWYLNKTNHVS